MKKFLLLFYCLALAITVMAQQTVVTGTVRDQSGTSLPGASVLLKGTTTGTSTDAEGRYSLNVPAEGGVLVFSFIGNLTEEVDIGKQTTIDVKLTPDLTMLGEIVVVGYGTQKKADVVGSMNSLSDKEFKEQPVTRIDQALQGRTTGVVVTNSGGAPGGDVRIRVRGANSIIGDNDPLYVLDGYVGADFTSINPQDIASIDVLKDAAATAIYGSRGANGVIIITTKSGKKGQMQIDLGVRYYSAHLIKKYKTLSAADFATVANERAQAVATENSLPYKPRYTSEQIDAYKKNGGTDWQDEIFRTAPGREYQVSLSGGNENTSFLISGNFLKQDGIILNSDFKRYSIRTNLNTQLTKKLSARFNFAGTRKENHNTGGTGMRNGILGQALAWAPTMPVFDASGNYNLSDTVSALFANPVALAMRNDYIQEKTSANIISGLQYEFVPGLSFDVQFGLNYSALQAKAFSGILKGNPQADAGRSFGEDVTLQNTNTLSYKKTINEHAFDITAVFESQKSTSTGFSANANQLTFQSSSYNNLALSSASTVSSGYSNWSLLSQVARINYSFKNRYQIQAAVRRDGSSKFSDDNKYSAFPSVALGWKLSEESFVKQISFINALKLRGSWGLTGNQGIAAYGTSALYVTNSDDAGAVFNGNAKSLVAGIVMGNPGNPNLKWETTEQLNAGIDLGLFQGKITFAADYFVKNTRDLLMLRPLPNYIGGYSVMSNLGEVQNKGWEFSLGATPIDGEDFTWNSSVNVTLLKNELVSLNEGIDTVILKYSPNALIVGQSTSSLWGLKYLGTWKPEEADQALAYGQKPGDARYADLNGDNLINSKDNQIIGNGLPKATMGWNNTFSFKGLVLNIFLQGVFGVDKLNYTYANGMIASTDAKEIIFADIKDRYIPGVNETSNTPRLGGASTNQNVQTSRFVEKGDFVRLKNVSLSYSIPRSVFKNVGSVKLFVSATNVLTFTNYKGIDPESNSSATSGVTWDNVGTDASQGVDFGSYPNSKTYTAGINFTF
jgi:TonB-dependent starch-binding outer membrane protein SusC